MKLYDTKIIETNENIEVWYYEEPIANDFKLSSEKTRRSFDELSGVEKVASIKRREKYYQNKRHEIKRLVECNFDRRTVFLTLTQNKNSPIKESIDVGNLEFQKFVKRLKRYLAKNHKNSKLKYIATWERTKKGLIHYHIILFSFPYIPAKKM